MKHFKLTTIAASLLIAQSASAAIYDVVEVTPSITANEYYSSAIQDGDNATDALGCFGTTCTAGDFALAGDTRMGSDGFSYRDEVPFRVDNRFIYLDKDDIENYCYDELGYNTCDSWADDEWYGSTVLDAVVDRLGGLEDERDAFHRGYYTSNASGFIESDTITPPAESDYIPDGSALVENTTNTVINKLVDSTTAIGITSSGYYATNEGKYALIFRQRGFYGDIQLLPKQATTTDTTDTIVERMGRTFAYDSFDLNGNTYAVGSGSVAPFDYGDSDKDYDGDLNNCIDNATISADPAKYDDCQNFAFATKGFVWNVSAESKGKATGVEVADWSSQSSPNNDDESAQASARAGVVPTSGDYAGMPVLAGFNTHEDDDNLRMQAAIFYPNSADISDGNWTTTFVSGARADDEDDGRYIYSNSLIKAMNDNLIAIGEAKRNTPEDGAYNNRIFVADASTGAPSADYLGGYFFFSGAGSEANAINNYNEIVGSIDVEESREYDGKQRRRRGFIYPYDATGTNPDRRAIFNNQPWFLDNLTNDGDASGTNNQYRIVNATGINDAGVISATARKCEGGYDNTSHASKCGDDSQEEILVAIKLTPIASATSGDIIKRTEDDGETIEREGGGSVGFLALGLMGMLAIIRRKWSSIN